MENPPRDGDPPSRSRLQHTVYERPVRILLECILVGLNNCVCGKTNLDHDDVVWYFGEFLPIVNGGSYIVTELSFTGCLIRFTCIFSLNLYFYHPPEKLLEGNVFSPVCLSVCLSTGRGSPCDYCS